MRAPSSTLLVLFALTTLVHVAGCLDVTPYPAIDAGSACGAALDDGGCADPDAGTTDATSASDGAGE